MAKHDHFLADAIKPNQQRLGYIDGFRFGFGFMMAGLLIFAVLGGISWGIILALHLV